ncbi:hypothetical protein FF38_10704 [Lucilia cuprina]|uniref:Uncharacterized protein n=1 Tax=Lucilia cuprina TaxID=7375 RepID=A0A0L0BZX6_LUCCU|nr:hypothetical protein FF38_10704 [Lucilia cuprina]
MYINDPFQYFKKKGAQTNCSKVLWPRVRGLSSLRDEEHFALGPGFWYIRPFEAGKVLLEIQSPVIFASLNSLRDSLRDFEISADHHGGLPLSLFEFKSHLERVIIPYTTLVGRLTLISSYFMFPTMKYEEVYLIRDTCVRILLAKHFPIAKQLCCKLAHYTLCNKLYRRTNGIFNALKWCKLPKLILTISDLYNYFPRFKKANWRDR